MTLRLKIVTGLFAIGVCTFAFARYGGRSEAAVASDLAVGDSFDRDEPVATDGPVPIDDLDGHEAELRAGGKTKGRTGAGGATQDEDPAPSSGGRRSNGDSNRTAPATTELPAAP